MITEETEAKPDEDQCWDCGWKVSQCICEIFAGGAPDAGTCGNGPIMCGVCWRCQLEEYDGF